MKYDNSTISGISTELESGKLSSKKLVGHYIDRIKKYDPKIGAYLAVNEKDAISEAEKSDKRRAAGKCISILDGIPIGIKDNILTKEIETTCASKILKGYIPPYSATVVEKLKSAGAIILGKLNMDEFAMGASSEHSAFKNIYNPWDLKRTPGGSSGGSAAAVAIDMAVATLGSDTGGSIRQPASFCGIVGLKPTYGRVSRYGLVAFASSLDQIGPLTKNVTDSAVMMNAISGYDPFDNTSSKRPVPDFTEGLDREISGIRIGIPEEYFIDGVNPDVKNAVEKAMDKFKGLGAILTKISLPYTEYAIPTYYIIAPAEASSNLARFDGIRYGLRKNTNDMDKLYKMTRSAGFGEEVKLRIIIGTFVLSSGYKDAYYKKALLAKKLIRNDFVRAFEKCDMILTPTAPTPAFKIGEKFDDPVAMYLNDVFTAPANLAEMPAISIPCGLSSDGLPIGVQLIGKWYEEKRILNAAYLYEQTTEWQKQRPIWE